jgi:hypothetical protein
VRYENSVHSSLNKIRFGSMSKKKRKEMRGGNEAVDIGGEGFAMGTDSVRLLLQRLQGPARPPIDVTGFSAAWASRAGRDGLEVAGPVPA